VVVNSTGGTTTGGGAKTTTPIPTRLRRARRYAKENGAVG
jgi:hypothetical protein